MDRFERDAMTHYVSRYIGGLLGVIGLTVLCVALAGCQTQGPRVAYMSAIETGRVLYTASAAKYGDCHAAATTDAEQDQCYAEKNQRGEQIGRVIPALELAAHGIIAADTDAGQLEAARAIMAELRRSLADHISPDRAKAINWLEAE